MAVPFDRAAFDVVAAVSPTAPERSMQYVHADGVVDLGWGHPDPATLPVDAVARAADAVLTRMGPIALSYGAPAGPGLLREAIAAHAADRWREPLAPAQVMVTAGASGALELVLTMQARVGDVVFVEQPTYFLALNFFSDHHLVVVPIEGDELGLFPDAFADAARRHRGDGRRLFLYCIPTHSNPRGTCLPDDRRVALLHAAAAHDVTVLEDDVYRDTAVGTSPPSLWSQDPKRVIRFGSFSKTIGPGLRVGFLTASPAVVAELSDAGVLDSGGGSTHLPALIVAEMIRDGDYPQCAGATSQRLRASRRAMLDVLDPQLFDIIEPAGGYFLWLTSTTVTFDGAFHTRLADSGVRCSNGAGFFAGPVTQDAVRLSASFFDIATLRRACAAINAAASGG